MGWVSVSELAWCLTAVASAWGRSVRAWRAAMADADVTRGRAFLGKLEYHPPYSSSPYKRLPNSSQP